MNFTGATLGDQLEQTVLDSARALLGTRWPGGSPLAYVHSYGCQQNVSDGERLEGVLASLGFGFADSAQEADLILLNTCAVREGAQTRVLGNIGALKGLKAKKPSLLIAVCGCMTQQPEVLEKLRVSYRHVEIAFGANAAQRLPDLVRQVLLTRTRALDASPPDAPVAEGLPIRRGDSVRVSVPIMQGCDNYCTYCIVPYVRGREHSRPLRLVVDEVRELAAQGCREITLLGQNVNSYGKGLDEPADFPALLRALDAVEGDFWIRFMTSHPKDCTHELIDTIAASRKVCRHIHLPVQSGSDRVLAAMNRRYTAAQYRALIDYARERIPEVSFTSDIIVGFPGETYEEFCETLALVRAVRYHSLFTFLYSPRTGTKAAAMEDLVPAQEKSRWFQELLAVQEEIGASIYGGEVGTVQRVLAEGPGRAEGTLTGRTGGGIIVQFPGAPEQAGSFVSVRMTKARSWLLEGEQER